MSNPVEDYLSDREEETEKTAFLGGLWRGVQSVGRG